MPDEPRSRRGTGVIHWVGNLRRVITNFIQGTILSLRERLTIAVRNQTDGR